jgi:UDP-N-acetylglucosamine:LPS N-acetylglucosamine transferase
MLIPDDEFDGKRLVALIEELLANPDRLAEMSVLAAAQARPNAAADIADLVETHALER